MKSILKCLSNPAFWDKLVDPHAFKCLLWRTSIRLLNLPKRKSSTAKISQKYQLYDLH